MSEKSAVCPACGARVAPSSEVCDLCGQRLDALVIEDDVTPVSSVAGNSPEDIQVSDGVFCNQCGWKNPLDARYCSRCGQKLQEIPVTEGIRSRGPSPPAPRIVSQEPEPAPSTSFGMMAAVMLVGAVLLVIVLYSVTAFSKKAFVASGEAPVREAAVDRGSSIADQVLPDVARQAATLRASADSTTGAVRAAKLAEIVNLYLSNGLIQHAASAQSDVAAALETAESWADAGNLGYRAMQLAEGQAKLALAQQAIDSYAKSLEIDSTNTDVRTDMATAYLATNNPMEGVRQIRLVLDQNADHVQANFNYGVMLSMIGRMDQAIEQFERVLALVPPGTETYQQAQMALEELRDR